MQTASLLAKKRDGGTLTDGEIAHLIGGFVAGNVSDDQMAALAMAICIRGMTAAETACLTREMLHSGAVLDWSGDSRPVIDKHSTGGVGDKVSLLLAPMLACEQVIVPMISGRGLGPTGGTLDKLESIPGLRTDLSLDEIQHVSRTVGCVISGATDEIAPADRRLYALRDVTGTVESIPLITASILSKKLAAGLGTLVLDVKHGSGAFMQHVEDARGLAESLVSVANQMGTTTTALVTDMNQPLGRMVGNAVEIDETVAALEGQGPPDLIEVTLALGAELLHTAGVADSVATASQRLQSHLDSGRAMAKLAEMTAAQGGDLAAPRLRAPAWEMAAPADGFVTRIAARAIGEAVIELGGGRKLRSDPIDHSTGLEMLVRIGDRVERGTPMMRIFAAPAARERALPLLESAVTLGGEPAEPPPLIVQRVAR